MGYISSLLKRYTGTKRRVDALFLIHAVVSGVLGLLGFLLPHLFEWVLVHHGERLSLRDNGDPTQKVAHLLVRCYAALISGQAWIVWHARRISDAHVRRALVQAYAGVFTATTVAFLRAQLTPGGGLTVWNWVSIVVFGALAMGYGWFAFFEKIKVRTDGRGAADAH